MKRLFAQLQYSQERSYLHGAATTSATFWSADVFFFVFFFYFSPINGLYWHETRVQNKLCKLSITLGNVSQWGGIVSMLHGGAVWMNWFKGVLSSLRFTLFWMVRWGAGALRQLALAQCEVENSGKQLAWLCLTSTSEANEHVLSRLIIQHTKPTACNVGEFIVDRGWCGTC